MGDKRRFRVSGELRVEFETEVEADDEEAARVMVEENSQRCLDGAVFEHVNFDECEEVTNAK